MTALIDGSDLELERGLVERHQSGDCAAFTQLYAQHYGRLVGFCLRLTHDHHDAEEIAQEAFTRAYASLHTLRGERRFYPWLTVIARRIHIDQMRQGKRVEVRAEVDAGVAHAAEDVAFQRLDGGHLALALGRIPERHRQVLLLRDWEGLSYEAIAARMDVSPATVPPLLHRARAGLRKEYVRLNRTRLAAWMHLAPLFAATRRLRDRLAMWASHIPDPSVFAAPMAGAALGAALLLAPETMGPMPVTTMHLSSLGTGLHIPSFAPAADEHHQQQAPTTSPIRSGSGEGLVRPSYTLRDAGVRPEETALRYVIDGDPNTWEARQERRRRMPIYYKHEPTGTVIAADPNAVGRFVQRTLAR